LFGLVYVLSGNATGRRGSWIKPNPPRHNKCIGLLDIYDIFSVMGSPYKALADDIRRDILNILSKSETKAGDIAGKFKISKPAISNHLKILKEAELVSEKKYQQNRIYSLNKKQIKQIISYLEKIT